MGTIFGKQTVAEPAFEVLYKHTSGGLPYEIRKYGERFAAEASYKGTDNYPFNVLAKYIGVFGKPENEGKEEISMTAPVVKEQKPTAIAMTAPVVKTEQEDGEKTMMFVLPAEYDSLSKIPRPTNPAVHIRELPPAVGAVHRYSGTFSDDVSREKARLLAKQLQDDGVNVSEDYVLQNYAFFGYNPPFTIPMFRRNEVWIELNSEQVNHLVNGFVASEAN